MLLRLNLIYPKPCTLNAISTLLARLLHLAREVLESGEGGVLSVRLSVGTLGLKLEGTQDPERLEEFWIFGS